MELDDTMSSTTTAIMQATKHDVFNERLLIKMLVDDVTGLSCERATETHSSQLKVVMFDASLWII